MDFQAHQQAVLDEKAKLHPTPEGEVFLTSLANREKGTIAGRVSVNTPGYAAILVVQQTHRESTAEEIQAWREHQIIRKREIEEAAAKKDSKFTIDMGQFIKDYIPKPVEVPAIRPSRSQQQP